MHDIDRTQLEFTPEAFEYEQFEQMESFGGAGETGEVFGEAEVMELAAELLEVTNEQELDRFLGGLISKAKSAVGSVISPTMARSIGQALKGVAKKALPMAGRAVGGAIAGSAGARIGSGLASLAGDALGLEAESLNQEDREFEGAKQFVRLAGSSVANARGASPSADPRAVAQSAVSQAARQLAPGISQAPGTGASGAMGGFPGAANAADGGRFGASVNGRSGRWLRRGGKIVLYGV